jgi:hypothetical protein
MGTLIEKFEQEDFPARTGQPYYYDDDGKLKKTWSKEIMGVGKKSEHGPHKQTGHYLKLEDGPGPPTVVYSGNDGQTPKPGDTLEFVLNDKASEMMDYPAYEVYLRKRKKRTIVSRLLAMLGMSK